MNTSRGHQTAAGAGLRAALHSYIHVARRPNVRPYFKMGPTGPAARAARDGGPWNVPDLCHAYNWPTGLAGGGVIAIVELGGGWVQSDMDQFFHGINQPVPNITDVSVDGTQNTPDPGPNSADGEVALDIEVAAAAYYVATGKPATIRMYWAQDIASAVRAATADGCDVCSISWGADEANWGPQAGQDMEQAATDATAAGMVVFAASGDNDSADGGPGRANVDLPSSAPHVIGCGGTSKTRTHETVWNNNPGNADGEGTGGGFSTIFKPMPPWQAGAPHGPGRMVPDVAANADPNTASFCTVCKRRSAEPAPSLRSMRGCLPRLAPSSASSPRNCGSTICASTTSHKGTTGPFVRGSAPTHAPGSARRSARSWRIWWPIRQPAAPAD